jgi:cysteine desulfurase
VAEPIYLDYNATTPIAPEVLRAMEPYLTAEFGNPSSGHVYGQRAAKAVELARGQVAALIGAEPGEIVFTSGATEANNLAIRGVANAQEHQRRHLVISAIEHPAVEAPCGWLSEHGYEVTRLGVDSRGCVSAQDVEKALRPDTILVSVMHANNEVGSVQAIAEITLIAHDKGVPVHTDAAQTVGKIRVRVDDLDVDLLTIAGHKMYAPKGIGALFVRAGTKLAPLMLGAGHEAGRRAGTENVPSIVGLGAACLLADPSPESRLRSLAVRFLDGLRRGVNGLRVHGDPAIGLPNTVNVSVPGLAGRVWLERAPGVAASLGAACHAGEDKPSAVLLAMGVPEEAAIGAVRFSIGRMTTEAEIDEATRQLVAAAEPRR